MKFAILPLVILSFVGIAVFGIFAMHFEMNDENRCLASFIANSANCPNENNALQDIAFHANAFKSFSTAIAFFAALASFMLILLAVFFFKIRLPAPALLFLEKQLLKLSLFAPSRAFTRWFALKEHSPTTF